MVEREDTKVGQEDRVIVILGPTATGKTVRAVNLCRELNGEVISADSRQVYRGMDIGTGKDLEEYGEIPYHLIDICEAGEKYNLHRYISDFHKALSKVRDNGRFPIVCGGTGMYLENAISGIRLPEVPQNPKLRDSLENRSLSELSDILMTYKTLHNTTDIDTAKRAVRAIEICEYYKNHPEEAGKADRKNIKPIKSLLIGIDIPRDIRRERISRRLRDRLNNGMIEEGRRLLAQGLSYEDLIYYGLEYKFMAEYLMGKTSYENMTANLEIAIHQFAKRQMTWFRGMERRGFKINWLPYNLPEDEFNSRIIELMNAKK